ncbi:hypothetical protein Q1695_015084 [Nippostrongylus brasiliensis]|nr:hypothetical protein Q1695_015084 [Nippostrongylus brasiliensis]
MGVDDVSVVLLWVCKCHRDGSSRAFLPESRSTAALMIKRSIPLNIHDLNRKGNERCGKTGERLDPNWMFGGGSLASQTCTAHAAPTLITFTFLRTQ